MTVTTLTQAQSHSSSAEGEDHLNQIISTIVMTIKQVLYARATEAQDCDIVSTGSQINSAAQGSPGEQATEQQMETLVIFTISQSKNAKHKEHKKEVSHVLQKYIQ